MTFDDAASATPVVTIPALTAGTELTFTLTVTGRATNASYGTAPDTDTATVTATDANAAPAFTSSATFRAAENQTAAGTVAASDRRRCYPGRGARTNTFWRYAIRPRGAAHARPGSRGRARAGTRGGTT